MELFKIIFALKSIGIQGITHAVINSIYRSIIDKKYAMKNTNNEKIYPGKRKNVNPISCGLKVVFSNAEVEIIFLSNDLIRITWQPGSLPLPFTLDDNHWQSQSLQIEVSTDGEIISCGDIAVKIDQDGSITIHDIQKTTLRKDLPPFRIGECWSIITQLKPEEHIYGLGERASTLNLRPGEYQSWNTDIGGSYSSGTDPLYMGTPIYLSLSSSGYHLLYFENSFKSRFSIHDDFTASFEGGALRYYIIFGPLEKIFNNFSHLTGFAYFPPKWALGYHQSRWGYQSEKEILEIVEGFKKHHLPISAIHLDIDYMDRYKVFTIDPDKFPHFKNMAEQLDHESIKIVASINPAVKQDNHFKLYQEGKSKDLFCKTANGEIVKGVSWPGRSVYPDFLNLTTRAWWADQYKQLLDVGISGFWQDMNEPASFAAWGDPTLPITTLHSINGEKRSHLEIHNLYGYLMNKAAFEGVSNDSTKRPWIFSRSGWAGLQKYAWNWTGDIDSTWKSLRQTVSTILGLSLSGHAFSGVDIGGFSGSPDAELYLRWFQLATFLPLFRTHSSLNTKRREPWIFGEAITNILRDFLKLRYKLLPYLYTSVWQTCQSGIPFIRPLFWEDPQDNSLWDIDDEFLLGDNVIIVPVLTPGESKRKVVLPPGKWFSYWDDHPYIGKLYMDMDISMEMIPIFIRNGSILPIEEDGGMSFHVYANINAKSMNNMYWDSGDGYGDFRLDTYQLEVDSELTKITCESKGAYRPPFLEFNIIVHGTNFTQASVDGRSIKILDNSVIVPPFQELILSK